MTSGLHRYYGSGDCHFITCSCYQRRPLLASAEQRDLFLAELEQVRRRYRIVVLAYVAGAPRLAFFETWEDGKRKEKLRYIHRNPVKRGLADEPDQWQWSSFRSYAYGEPGAVLINDRVLSVIGI
jgi:putative transposase